MSLFTMANLINVLVRLYSVQQQHMQSVQDNPDLVLNLPGLTFEPQFRHYSGYLQSYNDSYLHYWFFESENDPQNDPIVLWLNGGPGCSSMIGALAENGPFKVNKDLTLSRNPYSWNARANMLYIESPAQVGFSFKLDKRYYSNDNKTASHNLLAIRSFFQKFPRLIENDFYLGGESYAGIYVPMLASLMLNEGFPPKLRGYALGNGLFDHVLNQNSQFVYFYYHGIIDERMWRNLITDCQCNKFQNNRHCDFEANHSEKCILTKNEILLYVNSMDLNLYQINGDCPMMNFQFLIYKDESKRNWHKKPIPLPCGLDELHVTEWLNQYNVKQALNVPTNIYWSFCYEIDYDRSIMNVSGEMKKLANSGIRALIYNGDMDAVCNFLGVQWFIEDLGFPMRTNYSTWQYGRQIAGFWKTYGPHDNHSETADVTLSDGMTSDYLELGNHYHSSSLSTLTTALITFVTIRGAGHLAINDKPAQSRYLLYKFLNLTLNDKIN